MEPTHGANGNGDPRLLQTQGKEKNNSGMEYSDQSISEEDPDSCGVRGRQEKRLTKSVESPNNAPVNFAIVDSGMASKQSSTELEEPTLELRFPVRSTISVDINKMLTRESEEEDVAMVTTKTVDFVIDEVEEELARVMSINDDGLSIISDYTRGRAAATNTPVESYLHSRSLHTPVRNNIYDHALRLIKNRCSSSTTAISPQYPSRVTKDCEQRPEDGPATNTVTLPSLLSRINNPSFAGQPNSAFFISQKHPIPLEPLQVWKGYHSNVFFQPLLCRKMSQSQKTAPVGRRTSARQRGQIRHTDGKHHHDLSERVPAAETWHGNRSRNSADPRMVASAIFRPGTRQMSILDRGIVMSRSDQCTKEDIQWLDGAEAIGALKSGTGVTGRPRSSAHFYENRGQHYKLRICRGLVSHKGGQTGKREPTLDIGGRRIRDSVRNGPDRSKMVERNVSQQRSRMSLDSGRGMESLPGRGGQRVIVDLTSSTGRLDLRREHRVT